MFSLNFLVRITFTIMTSYYLINITGENFLSKRLMSLKEIVNIEVKM